jgi:hypothetical protein
MLIASFWKWSIRPKHIKENENLKYNFYYSVTQDEVDDLLYYCSMTDQDEPSQR